MSVCSMLDPTATSYFALTLKTSMIFLLFPDGRRSGVLLGYVKDGKNNTNTLIYSGIPLNVLKGIKRIKLAALKRVNSLI